jgi:hypothetical protein
MMHSTDRVLAFVALMGLPFLLVEAGQGQEEEPAPFEIRLPYEIRSEQAQVRYFLTGPFGGSGGFLKAEPERNAYLIGTSVNHQAAETLKVILYAPGCQIVTIAVRSLSESKRTADVSCEDLPTITFHGRVELSEALRRRPYEVEITYIAYWAHIFFGIEDGVVTTFDLAHVMPDEGGAFHVLLPNFTKDAVTESFHRNAGLHFIARERDTGNIVSLLVPANVQENNRHDLPIKPKYPNEVMFKPIPESPQNRTVGPRQTDAR